MTAEQIAEAAAEVLATDRVILTYLPEETS